MLSRIGILVILNVLAANGHAQTASERQGDHAEINSLVEDRVRSIEMRYAEEWEQIRREGQTISDEAPDGGAESIVDLDIKCESKRVDISFDVPEVSMNRNDFSLDLPQVSMETTSISWDNPETHVATTTCGYYVKCNGLKCRKEKIKCDLPQVRMVRREVAFDLPKISWEKTQLKLDIPEFSTNRVEWKFDVPDCDIERLSVNAEKAEAKSSALERRAEDLAERQQAEISAAVSDNLVAHRQEAEAAFTNAIAQAISAIDKAKSLGLNPNDIPQADGSKINLHAILLDLQGRRDTELSKIDKQIETMNQVALD